MNPKHFSVRMDRSTGEIWLTIEKHSRPVQRVKIITGDVLMALAAEIVAVDDTRQASRDVKFSDGAHIRLLVQDLTKGDPEEEHSQLRTLAQAIVDAAYCEETLGEAIWNLTKFLEKKDNQDAA